MCRFKTNLIITSEGFILYNYLLIIANLPSSHFLIMCQDYLAFNLNDFLKFLNPIIHLWAILGGSGRDKTHWSSHIAVTIFISFVIGITAVGNIGVT